MPSTDGIDLLVRKRRLSDEEWYKIIEIRRDHLLRFLDSTTLPELGSLECLRDEHAHALSKDNPTVVGVEYSLKTQGIFREGDAERGIPNTGFQTHPGLGRSTPDGTKYLWGLTRSGAWVAVRVEYAGEPGRKLRGYQRATAVKVLEVELPELIRTTMVRPCDVIEAFHIELQGWLNRSEQRFKELSRMMDIFLVEEHLLRLNETAR